MPEMQENFARDLPSGSASHASGALLGAAAVVVWNDVAAEGRDQFYDWHDKEHIPERLSIPGFRRGRRYSKRGQSPEWLTLYEASDLQVLVSPDYLRRLNAPTPLTVDTLRYFRNTSRAVCRVAGSLGSSSGAYVLALRLEVPEAQGARIREDLLARIFPRAMGMTGVLACHVLVADSQASYTDTAESRTRAFDVPAWVVLVECSRPEAAERARELMGMPNLQHLGVAMREDGVVYTLEICRLAS